MRTLARVCALAFAVLLVAVSVKDASAEERAEPLEIIKAEGLDSEVNIEWKISAGAEGKVKSVKVYKLIEGTESTYNAQQFKLVKDSGSETSFVKNGLMNGEQYVFQLKAYGPDDKEFWVAYVVTYPGTSGKGKPLAPDFIYPVSGDGKAAIFWEKNREADIAGYEIFRKGPGDDDFRLLWRSPKSVKIFADKKNADKSARFTQLVAPPVYVDSSVDNGKEYAYKVRAVDTEGNSSEFTKEVKTKPFSWKRPTGQEVLLLVNANEGDSNNNGVNDSEEVARHYAEKRGVPAENIFRIKVDRDPYRFSYAKDLQGPLKTYMIQKGIAGKIRYIVPCYGIPIGTDGRALDSKVADLFDRYTWGRNIGTPNPYFNSKRHFDGTDGVYLVTRLDGPDVGKAKTLVDKAIFAEANVTARKGAAYFGNHGKKGSFGDKAVAASAEIARNMGIKTVYRDGVFNEGELGFDAYWYYAWYHHYKDPVKGEWPTGAVGAHLISYSFTTIRENRPERLKSWVQGLLEKGITATFGSVIEPYLDGYTRADMFFESFWSGEYDFAESFYMATPTVQWAMSAVGDPLYRLKKDDTE